MFQFYLSSIKSNNITVFCQHITEFQFYLSSIKRKAGILVKKLEKCFNSTLVQLKVDKMRFSAMFHVSFNSTLVQLKAFYDASILSNRICFNSTLVQLKALNKVQSMIHQRSFNSTLVQLKVNIRQCHLRIVFLFQFYLSSIKSR